MTFEPTLREWQRAASIRFGPDPDRWLFECPSCGHVHSRADFERLGMHPHQVDQFTAQACIRRWTDGGCVHVGGPVMLIVGPLEYRPTFPFADADPHDSRPDRTQG